MLTPRERATALRILAIDAVEQAQSGHPGMPLGMADVAQVLWQKFLKHNPNNAQWPNRDRFILSNGHGSMLLYGLLHLTGYDLSLEDLKQFRQLHSKTPGHPEHGLTPGAETTTGPLGQGLANAVGMALAERILGATFNREGYSIVDHHTYVFVGDGCLMEGISHEVCSLAGTLKLGKLVVLWDDNGISIDGQTDRWFSDDTAMRFESYGWKVIRNIDGHDAAAIEQALTEARKESTRPTLIACRTVIGFGSPKHAGSEKSHGAPLGHTEAAETRKALGWDVSPAFHIPPNYYEAWDAKASGAALESEWQSLFAGYQQAYPELAREFSRRLSGALPKDWDQALSAYVQSCLAKPTAIATRKASQQVLNVLGPVLPELLGGSADLTESNCTAHDASVVITGDDTSGNYVHYGVREFGMSAMLNGLALYGGFIPYGGTFLTFVDYARNAVRMASLMRLRDIFVYTHDSIGLGEDGPTHQPIEQAAILRLTPNMSVWRPADGVETAMAWRSAILRQNGPTSLLLSRQNLPALPHTESTLLNVEKGGYVLRDGAGVLRAILIATGSEVALALAAAEVLEEQDISVRVVSMPSCDIFDTMSDTYRASVLPPQLRTRVAIEALAKDFWFKYVGLDGAVIGLDRYGESAPAPEVFQFLGITVEHIVKAVQALL